MNLARSSCYYRPKARGKDDGALIARTEAICVEFPRYGYRRVTAQLRHEGWRVNHKRVARIMRERGLSVKSRPQAQIYRNTSLDTPPAEPLTDLCLELRATPEA